MSRSRHAATALAVACCAVLVAGSPAGAARHEGGQGARLVRQVGNGRIFFSTGFVGSNPDPAGTTPQVYSIRPDGSGRRQLTHVPKGAMAGDPSVSPNGRTVAYVTDKRGAFELWLMRADGGH